MRSNKRKEGKPTHIVSAWSGRRGCLGQKAVSEKSNEITAIPELLNKIQIKGQIITIDAIGTQKTIAEKIRKKRADYVLELKRSQAGLYEDVELHFRDSKTRKEIREKGNYVSTTEKAHGQIEKRERKEYRYYISSLAPEIETFKRTVRGIGVLRVCTGTWM